MSAINTAYLCAATRTPIGSFGGSLASVSAVELGVSVVKDVLNRSNVSPSSIQEIILGCVLTGGLGQAPARQVALGAGLPQNCQAMTINKVCSSGLKAVMLAADRIMLGAADAIIAGGMESMSQATFYLPNYRFGNRLGHGQVEDSIVKDGLWDVYNNFHMGNAAELCASKFALSREMQDEFAVESYHRAKEATEKGYFKKEIVPVQVRSGKDELLVDEDEEPKRLKREKVSQLKPAFDKNGTVTAVNASSINDGASAMLVCSENFLKQNNLSPLGRIVSQGYGGNAPEWFTTAPISAVANVLKASSKTLKDVDCFEINEAFSAVALACQRELNIDHKRLNVRGGAVALGHPIGASGARILTTLLYILQAADKKQKLGIAALCNGGGEATALLVEAM